MEMHFEKHAHIFPNPGRRILSQKKKSRRPSLSILPPINLKSKLQVKSRRKRTLIVLRNARPVPVAFSRGASQSQRSGADKILSSL
jgi:hypothetical protein